MTRNDARPRSTRDIARALFLVGLFMAWSQLVDSVDAPRAAMIPLGILVTCGGLVGLGCVLWGGRSLRTLGWTFDDAAPHLVAVGLGLGALIVAMVFATYAALAGLEGVRGLAETIATQPASERLYFTLMGAKVAFVEETLFRGDLLKALRERFGVGVAVVLSAVVFSLFHRTLSPVSLGMKLLFGLVFAAATIRTGSLVPSAIGHTVMWAVLAEA